ncbi:MAG: WYL domain-containing protein [Lawsonella sp.]
MKSLDKVALALEIIPYLSQHPGISQQTVADHFGITTKELYAILEVAVCCGLPGYFGGDLIDIDIWGDNLYVYEGMGLDQPLRLSRSEQASLTLALRALEQVPGFVSSKTVQSILHKLDTAKNKVNSAAPSIEPATTESDNLGELISEACEQHRVLSFSYLSGTGDYESNREALPITVIVQDSHAYMVGWDIEAEELKRFRFDRMSDVLKRHLWRKDYPVNSLQLSNFLENAEAPNLATVEVKRDAVWLVEQLGLTDLVVEQNSMRGVLGYYTKEWLLRTALKFAPYLRIIHPDGAAKFVEQHADAALARYTSHT